MARAFAFGPDRRIRKRADFLRVQRDGIAVRTAHFVMLVALGQAGAPARLGVVATKKTGNAVMRNRVKRLCRECFRLAPTMLPAGIDLVVIAKPGSSGLGLAGVRAEWDRAAGKLRTQCEKVLEARPS